VRYVLAPLAGFTDAPFRRLAFEGGADLTYTEMVSAAALAHGHGPTHHLMETMPGEGPVACQLFGAKESDLAFAAAEVEKIRERFVELNLNAGCPMTKVTREGAGSKLIHDPERLHRLLKAMSENCSLPVTVKTRLGPRPERMNVFELLDAAETAGAKGFLLHARFTSQMHGGEVHLDLLREVAERAKIPVTGNGSVTDAKSAAAMAATGVAGLMIGRAALARPDIFAALKGAATAGAEARGRQQAYDSKESGGAGARGRQQAYDSKGSGGAEARGRQQAYDSKESGGAAETRGIRFVARHLEYLLEFRRQLAERFPDDHVPSEDGFASVKMHTHLFRYFSGQPGAAALRARLNQVRTLAEIRSLLADFG